MPKKIDADTLTAIRLLADAVRNERVPGIVEFRLLEKALDEVAQTPHEHLLMHASAAFRALDRDFRDKVVARAHAMAHSMAGVRQAATITVAVNDMAASKQPPPASGKAASPFLAALNAGGGRVPRR